MGADCRTLQIQGNVQQRRLPGDKEKKAAPQGTSHHLELIRPVAESQRVDDRGGNFVYSRACKDLDCQQLNHSVLTIKKMCMRRWADRETVDRRRPRERHPETGREGERERAAD